MDRRLVGKRLAEDSSQGFGGEVERALARRQDELVRQGHAEHTASGEWRAKPDLLRTLERQELNRVGAALAADRDVPFKMPEAGETVKGKLVGNLQLASGRFAILKGASSSVLCLGARRWSAIGAKRSPG
ncbi:MAG: DUF3363 domain-containing protein [Phenylobacterium sp.]|nr:DUF3363 domain-containing protein [Phenylobacterium sp.]MDP3745624.1 DUF3363 domain-containing protein [Phenylobacterium sp.]